MVPLISGLLALILPIISIRLRKAKTLRQRSLFSVGSFVCCLIAMLEELLTVRSRLFAGDIGGIEDTIGAVLLICFTLALLTTALNLAALLLPCEDET